MVRTLLAGLFLASVASPSALASHGGNGGWAEIVVDPADDQAVDPSTGLVPRLDSRLDLRGIRFNQGDGFFKIQLASQDGGAGPAAAYRSRLHFDLLPGGDAHERVGYLLEVSSTSGIELSREGVAVPLEGMRTERSHSYDYELWIPLSVLVPGLRLPLGDRHVLVEGVFAAIGPDGPEFSATDRAPDAGTSEPFTWSDAGAWVRTGLPAGSFVRAIATGPSGPYVLYRQYAFEGVESAGIFVGRPVHHAWHAQRIADVPPTDEYGNDRMLMVAGPGEILHFLFQSTKDPLEANLRYANSERGLDHAEDPAVLKGAERVPIEGGAWSVPDLAVDGPEVIVTLQRNDVEAVELVARSDGWHRIARLEPARWPDVATSPNAPVQVAWFQPSDADSANPSGRLLYASEDSGWAPIVVGVDLGEPQQTVWGQRPAYAFALDPAGRPHFVYENREGAWYATVLDGRVVRSPAPLLEPENRPHSQLSLSVTDDGFVRISAARNHEGVYAVRSPDGAWYMEPLPPTPHHLSGEYVAYRDPGPVVAVRHERPDEGLYFALPGDLAPAPASRAFATLLGTLGAAAVLVVAARGWGRLVRAIGSWRLWAPVFLFSRIQRHELLDHPAREAILEAVRNAPGASASDVRRDLDMTRTTFFYHVGRLETEELIRIERRQGQVYLFDRRVAAPPPGGHDRELLHLLASQPGLTAAKYARLLHRHPRTVRYQLERLEQQQWLRRLPRNARSIRWAPRRVPIEAPFA